MKENYEEQVQELEEMITNIKQKVCLAKNRTHVRHH